VLRKYGPQEGREVKPSERVITFIETSVNAAKPKRGKRTEYRVKDTRGQMMVGLVLDVLPGGTKVWRCHYDVMESGKRVRRKPKLGDHTTSLATIRKQWQAIRDMVSGSDKRDCVAEMREERHQAEIARKRRRSFRVIGELYVEEHAKARKRTWRNDEYKLAKYVYPVIGDMLMEEITRKDIKERLLALIVRPVADEKGNPLFDDQGRRVFTGARQADLVKALVSSVFNWARREKGVSVVNPAALIDSYATTGERQEVSEADIAKLWPILESEPCNLTTWRAWMITRIAFLGGQRLSEISGARKDELDLDNQMPIWKLSGTRTGRKNSKPHAVPLPPMLCELYRDAIKRSQHETLVFPSEAKDGVIHRRTVLDRLSRAYAECGISGVDFHSIRHTVETQLAKVGVDEFLRDRILDHKRRLKQSEGERYNHYDFYRPKYEALEKLEKRMAEIVASGRTQPVVLPVSTGALATVV
jgi:integrase